MLGVVPVSFWKEFGLDLDKETIDWEKIVGAFGDGQNWQHNAGIGNDMVGGDDQVQEANAGVAILVAGAVIGAIVYDIYETNRRLIVGEDSTKTITGGISYKIGGAIYSVKEAVYDEYYSFGESLSGNGTTHIENTGGITATEIQAALDRIEVIKTEYGIICNEASGAGCNKSISDFNENNLNNGYTDTIGF
jgi:hypothetical protein